MDEIGISGKSISLNIPFAKVDKENRRVQGFATLDNVDAHEQRVKGYASKNAFARFRGGIREMHQPVAVGTLLKFDEQSFAKDGKVYNGIVVDAYISKGAQDAWEKVLDGTYKGFSIGGSIKKVKPETIDGKRITAIEEYDLNEVSLVDHPANALTTFLSITKSIDGDIEASGMVTDTKIQNIYYNKETEEYAYEETEGFENIGWVEEIEGMEEEVQKLIDNFKKTFDDPNTLEGRIQRLHRAVRERFEDDDDNIYDVWIVYTYDNFVLVHNDGDYVAVDYEFDEDDEVVLGESREVDVTINITESGDESSLAAGADKGGVSMSKENETVTEEAAEVEAVEETEEEVTKAADNQEVSEEEDVDVDALVAAAVEQISEKISAQLSEKLQGSTKSFDDSIKEISEKVDSIGEKFEGFDGRLTELESGTAVKKSADVGNDVSDDDEDETGWSGTFLSLGSVG